MNFQKTVCKINYWIDEEEKSLAEAQRMNRAVWLTVWMSNWMTDIQTSFVALKVEWKRMGRSVRNEKHIRVLGKSTMCKVYLIIESVLFDWKHVWMSVLQWLILFFLFVFGFFFNHLAYSSHLKVYCNYICQRLFEL